MFVMDRNLGRGSSRVGHFGERAAFGLDRVGFARVGHFRGRVRTKGACKGVAGVDILK